MEAVIKIVSKNNFFIAVKIPDSTKAWLYEKLKSEKPLLSFRNRVHPADYHITLAFLGKIGPQSLVPLDAGLRGILAGEQSFCLTVNRLGTFGKKDEPRVFWAGVEPSEPLRRVREKVYNYCEKSGFRLDPKPFRPHITLARKWGNPAPFQADDLIPVMERMDRATFLVEEIALYETRPDQSPKYHPYALYRLH
jgi:2'-5' RNA ligase